MGDYLICFLCNDICDREMMQVSSVEGMDSVYLCDGCKFDFHQHVIGFYLEEKYSTIKFCAQEENGKIVLFDNLEDIDSYATENFSSRFAYYLEGIDEPIADVQDQASRFHSSVEDMIKELSLHMAELNYGAILVLDDEYLKDTIHNVYLKNYKSKKYEKNQFLDFILKKTEWGVESHHLFPKKFSKQVFTAILCFKEIASFTEKWAFPLKINKYLQNFIFKQM